MSSSSPSMSHVLPRVLFPQECSHDTHYLSSRGDLYTALITGGSRLLLLKNGVLLAQSDPLLGEFASCSAGTKLSVATASTRTADSTASTAVKARISSDSTPTSKTSTPCVSAVSVCCFTDNVLRVAVATLMDVLLFELDSAEQLWSNTEPPSFWRGSEDTYVADASRTASPFLATASPLTAEGERNNYRLAPERSNPLQATHQSSSTTGQPFASVHSTPSGQPTKGECGSAGRLRWRRVSFHLSATTWVTRPGPSLVNTTAVPSSTSCGGTTIPKKSSTCTAADPRRHGAAFVPVRISAPMRPSAVRAMDFVSEDTLCLVTDSEAVLIELSKDNSVPSITPTGGNSTTAVQFLDRVVWRSMGVYRRLSVCRRNHHVALSLGHDTIVVFPACVLSSDGGAPIPPSMSPDTTDVHKLSVATSPVAEFISSTAFPEGSGANAMTAPGGYTSYSASAPVFSPTSHPGLQEDFASAKGRPSMADGVFPSLAAAEHMTLAERGLTASVGIYRITDMQWNCVSSHTLLCVTCIHPKDATTFMMLYTLQSLSGTRRYTNIMEEYPDGGWGLCRGGYERAGKSISSANFGLFGGGGVGLLQLVPAGVIALQYIPSSPNVRSHSHSCANSNTASRVGDGNHSLASAAKLPGNHPSPQPKTPDVVMLSPTAAVGTTWGGAPPPSVAEMHTSLVPNFSRNTETNSMGSRMEFVHVEGDGTVRTSSYLFGRQKNASFAKQRALGLACMELLKPLLDLYGSLTKVSVLPRWRTRPIELGHDIGNQPCAMEVMLSSSQRYRLVLRFRTGVLVAVMVDLSAAIYQVEYFLALGCAPLLSLRTVVPLAESARDPYGQSRSSGGRSTGSAMILIVGLLGFPTPASPVSPNSQQPHLQVSSSLPEAEKVGSGDAGCVQPAGGATMASAQTASHSESSWRGVSNTVSHPRTAVAPARVVWGVVLLHVESYCMRARVLTVAPLGDVRIVGISGAAEDGGGVVDGVEGVPGAREEASVPACASPRATPLGGSSPTSATVASTSVAVGSSAAATEEVVASFMALKCPEKLRFMPALLKAVHGDPGRLLMQLMAKYGAMEESINVAQAPSNDMEGDDRATNRVSMVAATPTDVPNLSVLASACISAEGEVLLLLCANTPCGSSSEGGGSGDDAALIRLRPPCLRVFASVQRLVSTGCFYIPFEPEVVEYLHVPAKVQQRWWSQPLAQGRSSVTCATKSSHAEVSESEVRGAFWTCQRLAASARRAAVVQCEFVPESPGKRYIRVCSPLSPGSGEDDVRTARHHLPIPSTIDPKRITRVIGSLLVNNDVVIGLLTRSSADSGAASPILYLYGCPAVQSLEEPGSAVAAALARPSCSTDLATSGLSSEPSAFILEATFSGVESFILSAGGEVVLLRRWPAEVSASPSPEQSATPHGLRFERWLRCFPKGDTSGYAYVQDLTWCPPCGATGGLPGLGGRDLPVAADRVTALMTVNVARAHTTSFTSLWSLGAATPTVDDTCTCHAFYATAEASFIHVVRLPLQSTATAVASAHSSSAFGMREAAVPQYHPDALMQLIGMAQWAVLARVLTCVADAARAVVTSAEASGRAATVDASLKVTGFAESSVEFARFICSSAVERGLQYRPRASSEGKGRRCVTPPEIPLSVLVEEATLVQARAPALFSSVPCTTAAGRLYDLSANCGTLVEELTELLPQVTLSGLDSEEQLNLLHLLRALRDTLPVSRSVDEAAARHLLYSRYMSLRGPSRLVDADAPVAATTDPCAPIHSVLHFEAAPTTARTITTASFFWAALSDSQSSLVSLLFDEASPLCLNGGAGGETTRGTLSTTVADASVQGLAWEQVKQSGVALWLRSAADLRVMADRVARHQYHSTREIADCALMYCTARKVGTLAALARAQNNQRLHAFLSRDFLHDPHHRAAASANAYAAISKNMPQYGAAFFLLAGDIWSAVQVILQRCQDPALALFVLRAASDALAEQPPLGETPLEWYIAQRSAEVDRCGPLDMWELMCLSWIDVAPPLMSSEVTVQRRIRALQRIAGHPTANPEVICALRYARDCVASVAYRSALFLSPAQEVVCLLRLGRYCLAHRLNLNGYLHYRDAEALLQGLRVEAAAARTGRSGASDGVRVCGGVHPHAAPLPPKMAADFNTGTLLFRGFGSDSDDDQICDPGSEAPANEGQGECVSGVSDNHSGSFLSGLTLSEEAVAAVEAEVQYAYARTGAIAQQGDGAARDARIAPRTGAFEEILCRMLLSLTARSSHMMMSSAATVGDGVGIAEAVFVPSYAASSSSSPAELSWNISDAHESFQKLLTSLLHLLASKDIETQQECHTTTGSPGRIDGAEGAVHECHTAALPPVRSATFENRGGGWLALCIPLVHFLLSNVALQGCNYVMLLALQQIPVSTEGVLKAAVQETLPADCAAALRGAGDAPLSGPTDAATAAAAAAASDTGAASPPESLPSLYTPLKAFFRLLRHHMRQYHHDACEADGGRLTRNQSVTSATPWQGTCGEKSCMGRADVEAVAEVEDAIHGCSKDASRAHQSIFENMLPSTVAAKGATNCAEQVRGVFHATAGGGYSIPCPKTDADETADDLGEPRYAAPLYLTDSDQVSLLLSCCQAQLHLRLAHHLKELVEAELEGAAISPTTRCAMDAGILHADTLSLETQTALTQYRVLLCILLLHVTLQWCALTEECMMRIYKAQPLSALCSSTDPNGVFLEAQRMVKLMLAVLVAVLDAPPRHVAVVASPAVAGASTPNECLSGGEAAHRLSSDPVVQTCEWSTSWLKDNTLMLVELCATHVELFWRLPTLMLAQCSQPAAPTRAALRRLQGSSTLPSPARIVLRCLLRPVRVVVDTPAARSGVGNTGATVNGTSPASQDSPSIFSPAASPTFCLSPTQAESFFAAGAKQWGGKKQPSEDYGDMCCPALSYMQLAWIRRHHTHASLRWLLLMVTLDRDQGQGPRTVSTDRLILAHHRHGVTGVHFDASSCDSVVWTTGKGTSIGHGFRELLAGDNEEALWRQTTERNLATSAFTLELAAQHDRLRRSTEHVGQQHTTVDIAAVAAKSILDSRPPCDMAADAMPSSHPHLPFFVTRHRDGHLDLYPFASPESVASFRCAAPHGQSAPIDGSSASGETGGWPALGAGAGTTASVLVQDTRSASSAGGASGSSSRGRSDCFAVTPAAFSPNGYIIAAGLSDGSVACWRFAASAVESPPTVFLSHLFVPFGIRACTFCGARGSLLAVVGVTREPHQHPRIRNPAGSVPPLSMSADTPLTALRTPLAASPLKSICASATPAQGREAGSVNAGEMVGEVLILDILLGDGAITARCALPFIPSYAVYMPPLRAVLMVSVDGKMATYALATGRLSIISTVPLTKVLQSMLEPTLGADRGDAAPDRSSSTRSAPGSDSVYITCVARSSYDPLVALGVSNGVVLLLHIRSIGAAMSRAERRILDEGEDTFMYYQPSVPCSGDGASSGGGGGGSSSGKRRGAEEKRGSALFPLSSPHGGVGDVVDPAMGSAFLKQLPETTVLMEATCMQVAPHISTRSAIDDLVFSPSMLLAGLRDGKVMAASLIAHATRARLTARCTIPIHLLESA